MDYTEEYVNSVLNKRLFESRSKWITRVIFTFDEEVPNDASPEEIYSKRFYVSYLWSILTQLTDNSKFAACYLECKKLALYENGGHVNFKYFALESVANYCQDGFSHQNLVRAICEYSKLGHIMIGFIAQYGELPNDPIAIGNLLNEE